MALNLKKRNQAEYDVKVFLPKDDETVFYCKYISTDEDHKISKKYTEKDQFVRGQRVSGEFDSVGSMKERVKRTIVGWDNIQYDNEKFEFSDQNLDILFQNNLELCGYVVGEVSKAKMLESGLELGN